MLKYPLNLDVEPLSSYVKFKVFKRDSRTGSSPDKPDIALYMPENLQNSSTVSWDADKLGSVGGLLKNMKDTGSFQGASNHFKNNWSDFGMAWGGQQVSQKAAEIIGSNIDGAGLMGAMFQKIPNPFLTLIFRGVDFRTFEFVFKLYPHSAGEAAMIHEIIKKFRKSAYPKKPEGSDTPYFLEYPCEFEIEYFFNGGLNPWLHKFKRCALTGCDVNYTGQGAFYIQRDGFPTLITLSLRFSEIEILLRHDIEAGF
jgi:hypothetical protein